MKTFSSLNREGKFNNIVTAEYDLLIVGGGITGAGIALDAVSRGLRVALVEKNDFASGTSSRSTKLIHGGLRYLKQGQIKLVKETGKERKIVYKNARHLVYPRSMLIPVFRKRGYRKFWLRLALTVYDYFAGVSRDEKKRMLSKNDVLERMPVADKSHVLAGALYYEYKVNDARLTIEVIKTAAELGCSILNYVEVLNFSYTTNGKVSGALVEDRISGEKGKIYASFVVNATGPWVDLIRIMDYSDAHKMLFITKGIHLTVSKEFFTLQEAVYFPTKDSRMIFAIPHKSVIYIGTTDTPYQENLDEVSAKKEDVEYLLNAVNEVFDINLQEYQVQSTWAGVRPLLYKRGKKPSEMPRKDEIVESRSGLINIAGGKLTGYRKMAEKLVDLLMHKSSGEFVKCKTKNIVLSGADFDIKQGSIALTEYADHKFDEVKQTGIGVEYFKALFYRYGSNINIVSNKAFDYYNEDKDSAYAWIKAEVWYCIHYEMLHKLADFYFIRTDQAIFDKNQIAKNIEVVASCMASFLGWLEQEKERQIVELKNKIR